MVEGWPAPEVDNASVSQDSSLLPSPLTFAPIQYHTVEPYSPKT